MSNAPDDCLGNTWLAGQTVLLVEDNLIVGMAAAESLTMIGAADVIIATSVEQADVRVTTRKPDWQFSTSIWVVTPVRPGTSSC